MQKPKVFHYSGDKFISKINAPDLSSCFDFIVPDEDFDLLDIEKLLKSGYDLIEIAPQDYDLFKPYLTAVDWKINLVGVADALVKTERGYKPINILSDVLLQVVKLNGSRINSQLPVIVVGDLHFVITAASQLAMNGFVHIIFSLSDEQDEYVELVEKKIKSFVFNIDLSFVHVSELTTSEITAALFIADFKKETNRESYDLLAYFNFLTQGALFIDCNSITDSALVEDAKKAEIAVYDEAEFIKQKYLHLKELFKI